MFVHRVSALLLIVRNRDRGGESRVSSGLIQRAHSLNAHTGPVKLYWNFTGKTDTQTQRQTVKPNQSKPAQHNQPQDLARSVNQFLMGLLVNPREREQKRNHPMAHRMGKLMLQVNRRAIVVKTAWTAEEKATFRNIWICLVGRIVSIRSLPSKRMMRQTRSGYLLLGQSDGCSIFSNTELSTC